MTEADANSVLASFGCDANWTKEQFAELTAKLTPEQLQRLTEALHASNAAMLARVVTRH